MTFETAEITPRVDEIFAAWDNPDSPGCALAVVFDGSVVYQRGYGMANLEYGIPITPATIFHVASISKQFTSCAITLLAQEGKLSLDDDIRKHFPEFADFGKTITIRHLRHHISGLRDQWDLLQMAGWRMEDVITEQDILDLAWAQRELNFEPGSEHLYCNTGYTLQAVLVKRLTGQTLREFARERIFTPLGMTDTHFHDDHRMIVPNRAYSYAPRDSGGFEHRVLSYANVGTTSLFTTAEDLAKWNRQLEEGIVGGQEALADLMKQGMLNNGTEIDYAAGLAHSQYRGLKTVGHAGADAGFRSDMLRFPSERFTVIILSNVSNSMPPALSKKVADIYLADRLGPAPVEEPAADSQQPPVSYSADQLDEYAGEYFSDELMALYTVARRDDKLFMSTRKGEFPLTPSDKPDVFLGALGEAAFTRSRSKRITGFLATTGRVRNLRFRRSAIVRSKPH